MRLNELGLSPATQRCLRNGGIHTTYRLLDYSCRELIWHSTIGAAELHEVLCRLNQHGMMLPPTPKGISRPPGERNLEVFRLRVVEGRSLKETGERVGIGHERVRQVLARYFGLRGSPPAVKARRRDRSRGSSPDCAQAGRAIARLRCAKGLTIEHLATHAEMSTEHLERIEDGLRDPAWTTLSRLAVGLDTTVALLAYAIEVEKP
jgi:DNA-binding XRE family transcriptional regulator